MPALHDLIETITKDPQLAFVQRTQSCYGKFLQLYEDIGYAPVQLEALDGWRKRSCNTWRQLDARLPGTMTGGRRGGEIVSSWGTLPLSQSAVYSHSVCMLDSLPAAATLCAQAIHSLSSADVMPGVRYWVGSYPSDSKFIPLQKPPDFEIPGQLELELVRCEPSTTSLVQPSADVMLVSVTDDHRSLLSENHRPIVAELERPHPALLDMHSIAVATVRDRAHGTPLALVLLQTALPELTAANVYSWVWVFPFADGIEWSDLCRRLRRLEILSRTPLQIAAPTNSAPSRPNPNEKLIPSFWRFTPRAELPLLRRSFQSAFESLLSQYSDEELKIFTATLNPEDICCQKKILPIQHRIIPECWLAFPPALPFRGRSAHGYLPRLPFLFFPSLSLIQQLGKGYVLRGQDR